MSMLLRTAGDVYLELCF